MSAAVPAFGSALRKGLGRAMILLRQEPGSPALQAELMRACKTDLFYDGYVGHDRAPYLHRLIRATGRERHFGEELSRWLMTEAGPDDDDIDTAQAFYILCLLAADDASFDRAVLHDFVRRRATYDTTGVGSTQAFIRLEGVEALLLHVRRFADEIAGEPWLWSFKYLVEALGEREGPEAAASALEAARATCPELDRLMILDASRTDEEPEGAMDYAAAKEALAAGGRMFPGAWARNASPEELAQAARDLLAERDPRKIRAYLGLFRRRDFPAPATSLFPFLRHEDDVVAKIAAEILGRIGGSDVRGLALELIDGERPWNGIAVLKGGLRPGDFDRIGRRLADATLDADGWHDVGQAVFGLLEDAEVPPDESRAVLLRLYEEEPCSFCRERVVEKLAASGGLPGWMAEECLHDAEPDTVSAVQPESRSEGATDEPVRAG